MRKHPIILIPGIQGTTLSNVNEKDAKKVYSGIKKYFKRTQEIELQKDGISDKEIEVIISPSDVEDLAYSEIIDLLRKTGFRVYIFGYDWRLSNHLNAQNLRLFVEKLSHKLHNTNKFNFLTHSMGGLVFSSFVKLLHQENRVDKVIEKAIMCNPPFLGSHEAAFNLVVGRSRFINSSDDFRKVARTFPSLYELSSVYANAFQFDSDLTKDVDYFDFDSYWQHEKDPIANSAKEKNALMKKRFRELKEIRNDRNHSIFDFDRLDKKMKKNFLVLVGSNDDTLQKITIKNLDPSGRLKNYFDFERAKTTRHGDGTVHHDSSTVFKDSILTIDIKSIPFETRWNSHLIMNDWHSFFLNNGRVQNIIRRFMDYDESTLGRVNGNLDWYFSPGSSISKV